MISFRCLLSRSFLHGRLFLIVACLLHSSCAKNSSSPTSVEKPLVHTIKYRGETLAAIASWYTGKRLNFVALQKANPSIEPTRMRIGQKILIPAKLVKRRDPLQKSSLGIGASSSNKKSETKKTTPREKKKSIETNEEEIDDDVLEKRLNSFLKDLRRDRGEESDSDEFEDAPSSEDDERQRLVDEMLEE